MQYEVENGKRYDEYTELPEVTDGEDVVLVKAGDGTGTKRVRLKEIVAFALRRVGVVGLDLSGQSLTGLPEPETDNEAATKKYADTVADDVKKYVDENFNANNAAAHTSIYRGKYLGSYVTEAQYAAISAGTFDDLYVGDYWTIGGVNYRIADFDYYYNTGDTACTKHHVVVVPDTQLYTHCMNDTNDTTGAYVGSKMYTEGLESAKATIKAAFGESHILTHRQYLANATSNGVETGGSWYDSQVELMTEQNVYGCKIFGSVTNGTTFPALYTVDKSQYQLFRFAQWLQTNRQWYWLRDVATAAFFADAGSGGYCDADGASNAGGVRPAFSIC